MSFDRLIFSSRILSLVEYTREYFVVARIDERFRDVSSIWLNMTRVTSSMSDKRRIKAYILLSPSRTLFWYTIQVVVRSDRRKKAARDASVFGSLSKDDGGIGRLVRLDAASRETRGTPRDAKRRIVSCRYTRSLPLEYARDFPSWRTVLYCIRGRVLWTTAVIVYVGVAERETSRLSFRADELVE